MAPLPQDHTARAGEEPLRPDQLHHEEVVISGMSAAMPGCKDMMEFAEKLYGKENLAKCGESRWNLLHPELPPHSGKIHGLDRFDAQFFMVNSRLAHFTDVMSRKLLELSYEALFDAGMSAAELNGKRVGVFVAVSYCESEKFCSYQEGNQGIAGCNRAMFANRISYWLNSNGPSIALDCNGCGSIVALEQAHQAILSGRCESAIVGACRTLLHPQSIIHYGRQVPLNETGVTKSYDLNADGETLSECIGVLFLQKQKDARRIYASIAHVKTGYNAQVSCVDLKYTPNQEPESFKLFLEEFYKEAGIPSSEVEYVEGFGSGLSTSDKDELEVIDKIFTKDRKKPLPVGTVISNVGYTEAVSGITSLIKLLLAYQNGEIAGNINYVDPRIDVAAIREGRIKIITEHLRFNRTYTALNTFSIIGAYGHVLLKGKYVHKDTVIYKTEIPYLMTISGRHDSAVQKIINWVKSRPINHEEILLLNTMHKVSYSRHLTRGFGILKTVENKTKLLRQEVEFCDINKRSLWFVYSGMGSQWVGMGKQLMCIPIFADAIKRCSEVLTPKGVDIVDIITSQNKTMFDNILHSFIGIAAIQIGITDILKAVGIVPDFIIGHSVGELGCAYADGCVTTEEMILLAFYRGLVSIQTPVIKGSMAAIGLGYKQILKLLPPEIEVACHNSVDSCTISGPADIMKQFVNDLSLKGIFAKEVACSNIAYHSKYIATAGPKLLEYCRKVIKTPKKRSNQWLSTSVPKERWNESLAIYSSAEYHVNNLLNPVLFEETCKHIPANAVIIEVAPHGLLQAILKRSLPHDCDYIPLTRKNNVDNAEFLLEAIGKIYLKGYDVDVSALYPTIEYPVSTETSSLSYLVEWDHREKWNVCYYVKPQRLVTACYKPIVTIYDDEYQYLDGYNIQGKRVLPYTVALLHVWDTLAMIRDKKRDDLSVQFHDVHFYSQPALLDQNVVHLKIELHKGSGRFEVYYEHGVIIEGFIMPKVNNLLDYNFDEENEPVNINNIEIYKILREKGYNFKDLFKPIQKINKNFTQAELSWSKNWVTLIEGMIQMKILTEQHDGISKLEHVRRLSIDVKSHYSDNEQFLKRGFIESRLFNLQNTIKCGGVTIENVSFKNVPKQMFQKSVIKPYKFVPFFQTNNSNEITNYYVLMQIVSENIGKETLTVLNCGGTETSSIDKVLDLLKSSPEIKIKLIHLDRNVMKNKNIEKPDVVIVDKNQLQQHIYESFYTFLPNDTFLISTGLNIEGTYPLSLYKPVASMGLGIKKLELAIWKPSLPTATSAITVKTTSDFEFLRNSHADLQPQHKLLIFTSYPPVPGLKELVKEMRCGPGCQNVCTALIDNYNKEYLDNSRGIDLAFNVFTKGTWGGEYILPNIETELISSRYVRLQILQPGNLNSLSWVNVPQEFGSGIAVTVHFAGLNMYDARKVTGEVACADTETFGMDFSGVTESGSRVMGMVNSGSVSSLVRVDPQLLWPVPEYWSLEDAATVPLAYCLAFYCLTQPVALTRGKTILVHGGAGGLGQAVISIALAYGCTVFSTVSNLQKKRFLRKLFPDLPADHIGSSRNDSFSDMVLQKTKGEGCDIIISCVKGNLKNATLRCCAASGTTIDTVQIHTREDYRYGMFNMMKSRNYVAIDFISIFNNQNREVIRRLHSLVSEGIVSGYVRPLSRVTYEANESRRALMLLVNNNHRGRVLLKLRTLGPNTVVPRLNCSVDKFQLIVCDDDDLGIQLADKLVKQGAKKLLLHHTKSSTFLDYKKRNWKDHGVQFETSAQTINDKKSSQNFLKDISRFGFFEGIYIVASKTDLKINSLVADIDAGSREIFTFLRHFVVISRDDFVGYDIHLQRINVGLPSTLIQLHNLEEFNTNELESSNVIKLHRQTALEGIERALCKESNAYIVYSDPLPADNILDEIAKITGLDSIFEMDDNTTLKALGLDEDRAALLHKQVERMLGIYLVPENIPNMKLSECKQLQVKAKNLKVDEKGLECYFNYIDIDEIRASCDLMPLHTLANTSKQRPEEFDMEATYLCIVPGLEGSYKRFRQVGERLKLPALVLQLGPEHGYTNYDQIAERLSEVIRKKLKLKENFYLLGYEFGVSIVLKLAELLESFGLTGTVYCLGGTPEDIRKTFKSQIKYNDIHHRENTLLIHAFNQLAMNKDKINYLKDVETDDEDEEVDKIKTNNENNHELTNILKDCENWEEKVKACLKLIKGKTTHTHQYAKVVIETINERLQMLMNTKTSPVQLKSKIIFLRSNLSELTEDLSLYSNDFEVHNLDSTIANMTDDLQIATIVNKYLSKEILETYENSNHCETVILTEDMFSAFKHEAMRQAMEE